jgi:hypothetical protein
MVLSLLVSLIARDSLGYGSCAMGRSALSFFSASLMVSADAGQSTEQLVLMLLLESGEWCSTIALPLTLCGMRQPYTRESYAR